MRRLPKPEKAAEAHDDHHLAVAVPHDAADVPEDGLALHRLQHHPAEQLADPDRLGNRMALDCSRLMPGGGGMPPGVGLCA